MGTHLTCNQVFGVRFPIAPPLGWLSYNYELLSGSTPQRLANSEMMFIDGGAIPPQPTKHVSVAQLEECLPSKQDVVGSNPITDTNINWLVL
jgi:hypothetical protein